MSDAYWDTVVPTYIENWPAALCSLSIPQVDVPLTVDDARRLGTNIIEFGEAFCATPDQRPQMEAAATWANSAVAAKLLGQHEPPDKVEFPEIVTCVEDISDIRAKVASAVNTFPGGAFVRLGSRSPKDSWEWHRIGAKISSGEDPLRLLCDASERIYEDLALAISRNYSPHIFARQWLTIPEWSEFRCFMQGRKLVGISQYNYFRGAVYEEIVQNADTLRWVIAEQFFPDFLRASHLADVVFDVFVKCWSHRDNSRVWEVKLLEVNPFFEMTDPCMFAWKDGFDGSFRFNKS